MIEFDAADFQVEFKSYVTIQNGRAIVIENVPYCIDPRTKEEFLHAKVYEELWNILHGSQSPVRQITGDVYQMTAFGKAVKHAKT